MKHTCKRLTALVLALAMCFSLLAPAWAADVEAAEEVVAEAVVESVEEIGEATEEEEAEAEPVGEEATEEPEAEPEEEPAAEEEATVEEMTEESAETEAEPVEEEADATESKEAEEEAVVSAADVQMTVTYGQTEARSMLTMINKFRTGNNAWYWNADNTTKTTCTNLGKLTYDYTLEAIAMQRAAEIALSYSHTRPNGTSCLTAYTESAYEWGVTLFGYGENIAYGYTSAKAVFEAWEEADEDYSGQGHRRNMLNSNFNAVGIAHVVYNGVHYWVQEFGYLKTLNTTATTANNSATTVSIEMAAPTLSSVSNTSSGVKVTWETVAGASGYRVYRKAAGASSWTAIKSSTTSTSYTDTTAKSGTTYYYTVRAYRKVNGTKYWGNYNKTGLKITFLSRPTLSSVKNTSSGVKVTWKRVYGATGYIIYRKTGSGSYERVKKVTSETTLTYKDTEATGNGTKYTYKVKAYKNDNGTAYKSSYSSAKSYYHLTSPTISSLTNSASKKMTVKWDKNSKATGYQIQYSTSSDFSSYKTVTVTSASTVSKTISSLTKGKKYYVRVRAYKTVSGTKYYSAWSSKESVKISQ